jgi:hypothetical protein
LFTLLRNAYYLSAPVVLGAVLSNRLAARLSDVDPIHWATPIVLALVVYIIYTADRLFDVRKLGRTTPLSDLTARHRFHRLHETQLWWSIIAAGLVALVLVFFLPWSVIEFGLVLGIVCTAYIAVVFSLPQRHPSLLLKEPLVAVLYTVGVWGSVWVQRPSISGTDITEGLMFMAVAFQNLLLFAVMEELEHSRQADFSLATYWGLETSKTVLTTLTVLIVGTALTLCFIVDDRFAQRSALILGLMSLALYVIQRFPNRFVKHERYRWLGDAVFWFPALVL